MGFTASFFSELFRARRMHVGFVLLGLYFGIACLYAFASSGAWVSAGGEERFIGFSADPSYVELIGISIPEVERFVIASLAHTVLFPVAAVLVAGMFFDTPFQGSATEVSQARGVGAFDRYLAQIAVCCLYLGATYAAFSIPVFAVYCMASLARIDTAAALLFAWRLVPNVVINTSFIVLCISTFTLLRIRPLASGGLLVLTYAGLVAAMSSTDFIAPVHMAHWMRTCSTSGTGETFGAIVFSIASCFLCIIVTGASLKLRQAHVSASVWRMS